MNKTFSFAGMCLILLFLSLKATATHIYGGELLYTHITGTQYKVSLTIYGDCAGDAFPNLTNNTPQVMLYNGTQLAAEHYLSLESAGVEVSPVCEKEKNNTACKNPANLLPGVMKYIYSKTISINAKSANWRLIFFGNMSQDGQQLAGRSQAISNILFNGQGGSLMVLEAILNNLDGQNSSPVYSSIPTPFFCINKPQQYNQGAVDPDNDSLTFSLISGLEPDGGGGTFNISYLSPFTSTEPLATVPGTFSYNNINGQMSFTPNMAQSSLVVNKIEEYKNGVLVGSSMREMTFVVFADCNNTPPASQFNASSLAGGKFVGDNTINVCQGTGNIHFVITGVDPEGDNINVTSAGIPDNANLQISNNDTTEPVIIFDWNAANVPPGNYNVYLNFKDNGCPLTSSQTTAYTIRIIAAPALSYNPIFATGCIRKEYMQLKVVNGLKPYEISIQKDGQEIHKYVDTTGTIRDSLAPGKYTAFISSPDLPNCGASLDFVVADSGAYPVPPKFKDPHYCKDERYSALVVLAERNCFLNWYTPEGVKMEESPTFNTSEVTTLFWLVSQQYSVCESEKDTLRVYVHENPDVQINNKSKKVCKGDGIYLEATGAEKYRWIPDDKIQRDRDTSYNYAEIMEPVTFRVVGTNRYGCTDTDYVSYEEIEQCCRFYYPNAFTPNWDGKNDGFKVNMYGNAESFDLIIFNRWGQKVFQSNDAEKYWDGNFAGNACDVGVYYYILRAKCVTGHLEETKGEVTLIR